MFITERNQAMKIESSMITEMDHDEAKNELTVKFTAGSIYRYKNVTKDLFEVIINADSVGSTFTKLVKKQPDKYPYEKV